MLGIDVEKVGSELVIRHQLTKVEIPINDIVNVTSDDTYAGKEKDAIRIGSPYGNTDRIAIQTKTNNYVLFTTNYTSIMNKIKLAIVEN
ncbi:hypothetical protein HPT25_21245 [Bacillus sp. BRMEA1]|uniref:SunI/YnzG family protein n=1 Tax=Neobacillus endophyticus TaxID=2738405 RepID=UPI001567A282|nr:hypothetical protein [Neobacillus endophyticus]NRD79866.1 hypothetical protein [Neobacillus endophyticus]